MTFIVRTCYRQFVKFRPAWFFLLSSTFAQTINLKTEVHYFSLVFPSYPNFSSVDEIELRTEVEERLKMGFSPLSRLFSTRNSTAVPPNDLKIETSLFGTDVPIIFKFQINWLGTSGAIAERRLKSGEFSNVLQLLYGVLFHWLDWNLDMTGRWVRNSGI